MSNTPTTATGPDGAPISLRPEQMRQSRVGKRPVALMGATTLPR